MTVRLLAAAASETGGYRTSNQDSAFTAGWGTAVADGVGGGPSGDLASATLVHRLVAEGLRLDDRADLIARIREANWDIGARVRSDPALQGMATTFTGLFTTLHGGVLLAHSGDSRAYRLRHAELQRQTRDDSYVQALVDRGLLAPAAAASHPRRNVITASLGGGEGDTVSVFEPDAAPGDRWMLCSDGVSDYLEDEEIGLQLLRHRTPRDAASALVREALEAGSRDNVTAIVCDIREGEADAEEAPVFYGAAHERFQEGFELGAS